MPYGFHAAETPGAPGGDSGFPVFLDINLSEEQAQRWVTYLREGLYLAADRTDVFTAQLVVYNSELRLFGNVVVRFDFGAGGSIEVSKAVQTVDVAPYADPTDYFRMFLEICTLAMAFGRDAQPGL